MKKLNGVTMNDNIVVDIDKTIIMAYISKRKKTESRKRNIR